MLQESFDNIVLMLIKNPAVEYVHFNKLTVSLKLKKEKGSHKFNFNSASEILELVELASKK